LDLDLLFYGSRVVHESGLIIPHPRLHLRRFVLEPLAELDPEWKHPQLGATVQELLVRLPPGPHVRRLAPQPHSRYGSRPGCGTSPPAV
jgi:2-amino-4-hydroxy-6-hydroxymethyldihydropteridine diphosphokinase